MAKNYYEILGITKSSSKDEIKKAFHKLAHKYHPDKSGGDEAKFKEVNEAYTILSNDKKKAEYDSYGRVFNEGSGPGSGQQGGPGGFGGFNQGDFQDFDFSQFTGSGFQDFNMGDIFGDLFGGGRARTVRGRDISIDLEMTFSESIFGTDRSVLLRKTSTCETCKGNGAKPGTELVTCTICNGKGKIHETKQSFLGAISTTRVCDTCHGSGKIPKEKCATCHGAGVREKQEEIKIEIPPGINNGEMIRMTGAGEAVTGGTPGDLYIKIHVKPHATFKKEGMDLYMDLNVKLTDALLGDEYTIETLDGKITVKIPEGIKHGELLRVKGKGVPAGKNRRGDLLIKVAIQLPTKLSKDVKKLIEELKEKGV